MDFLDGGRVLAGGHRQRVEPHRAAAEFVNEHLEQALVHFIEALGIDLDHHQRRVRDAAGDAALAADLGEVAHPAQQGVGHPRRAARAGGDFQRAFGIDRHIEQAGRALDDAGELVVGVIVEAVHQAEARAQRCGEHARAGGGTHQREARQVDLDGTRRRPGIDDDIQPVILHRRIQIFLDGGMQAVDFIDEEHVALLDVGEDAGEVARLLDLRAGGGVKLGAGSARNQVGQRGLAEAGRAGQQHVIEHIATLFGRLQHQQQAVLHLVLADELGKRRRAQRDIEGRCRGGGRVLIEIP